MLNSFLVDNETVGDKTPGAPSATLANDLYLEDADITPRPAELHLIHASRARTRPGTTSHALWRKAERKYQQAQSYNLAELSKVLQQTTARSAVLTCCRYTGGIDDE